ncbi:MAG TPA: hypothetical protein VFV99_19660, partial [Kofleriaceae bacterium]|nr:hypothetical protein [Kofleriaceae bacterium]
EALRQQLENPSANENDVSRAIDNVSRLEADIRKARIIAWVKARRVLDDGQRQKVERSPRRKSR